MLSFYPAHAPHVPHPIAGSGRQSARKRPRRSDAGDGAARRTRLSNGVAAASEDKPVVSRGGSDAAAAARPRSRSSAPAVSRLESDTRGAAELLLHLSGSNTPAGSEGAMGGGAGRSGAQEDRSASTAGRDAAGAALKSGASTCCA